MAPITVYAFNLKDNSSIVQSVVQGAVSIILNFFRLVRLSVGLNRVSSINNSSASLIEITNCVIKPDIIFKLFHFLLLYN